MGHLIQQIDGTGHQVNYSFDANGNIARSWQVLTKANQSALIADKRYLYDAENHLIQSFDLLKPTAAKPAMTPNTMRLVK